MFNFKEGTKEKLKIAGIAALGIAGVVLLVWGLKLDNTSTIESSDIDLTNDELAEKRVA